MLCSLSRDSARGAHGSLFPTLRMFGARAVFIVSSGALAIASRYGITNGTMPLYLRSQVAHRGGVSHICQCRIQVSSVRLWIHTEPNCALSRQVCACDRLLSAVFDQLEDALLSL